MTFPLYEINPYHLLDYIEHYTYWKNKSKKFNRAFPTFQIYFNALTEYKHTRIKYLHIQYESRRYSYLYD